jgi:hypothetical protein
MRKFYRFGAFRSPKIFPDVTSVTAFGAPVAERYSATPQIKQPRCGERMQPTAQAVGGPKEQASSPGGA